MDFTREQKDAIFIEGCNLLVSAGAGSGKTAVLVERIINKITRENPVDVDRLLVVTFTNAAATEMRERILKRITEELQKKPEDKNLIRQSALINRANIMTIDAFCKKVVEQNFQVSDLDPDYKIINEDELVMLRQEALEEVLEEYYEKGEEDFLNLSQLIGGQKNDDLLEGYILSLARFSESFVNPDEWINMATKTYEIDETNFYDSFFYKEAKNIIIETMEEALVVQKSIIDSVKEDYILVEKELDKIYENEYGVIEDTIQLVKKSHTYDQMRDALINFTFPKFKTLRFKKEVEDESKALKDETKKIRDEVLKSITSLVKNMVPQDEKTLLSFMKELNGPIKALGKVTISYRNKLKEKKKEKNRADFSDIAHTALNILIDENGEPTVYAKKYQDLFLEIMIDEYQDSNDIQELILNAISKNKDNIFMVGDVKQSIYRFRQAKPELFLNKYDSYFLSCHEENEDLRNNRDIEFEDKKAPIHQNLKTLHGKKVLLYKNFRSRDNVINAVNTIFKALMSKRAGEIDYTEDEELILGSSFKEVNKFPLEVNLIDVTEDRESSLLLESNFDENGSVSEEIDEEAENSKIEVEAKFIANRILKLKQEDKDLKYSDIVILLRATNNVGYIYKEALNKLNIPVFQDSNTGYFENIEVRTIMSLLKVIDNPMQDIPLISVLRSPLFNFSEDQLIDIRIKEKNKLYYEALKLKSKDIDELGIKCKDFIKTIENWKDKSLHMSLDEFIWMIYKETAYYEYVEAMPNGVQRSANLRALFQRAGDFEKTTYKGLYNFVRYVDKLKVNNGDLGEAKIMSEKEDVVRIMSIHKSKGLEFPVVFISNLSKKFNRMDQYRSLVIHGKLGVGAKYTDINLNFTSETLQKRVIRNIINKESISEEMRVLYVALTRAKERLILTGTINKLDDKIKTWGNSSKLFREGKKAPLESLQNGTMYDWILPILMDKSKVVVDDLIDEDSFENEDFKIYKYKKSQVLDKNQEIIEGMDEPFYKGENLEDKEVIDVLNFTYKNKEEISLPSKVSVSVIKKKAISENEDLNETKSILDEEYDYSREVKKPRFLKENRALSGADRGTAFHTVMMHIDPNLSSIEEIDGAIKKLVEKEILLQVEAESVNRKKVLNFLKSELGIRFREAESLGHLYKEEMFYELLPANSLFSETKSEEKISMIGIIDAFFEEDGELVLLDYKTDAINKDIPDFLLNKYKKQIELYKNALETITGKRVKESYLYSVSEEKVIRVF